MVSKLKNFFSRYGRELFVDLLALAGLAMMWYGIYLFSLAISMIVVGSLLIIYSVFSSIQAAK